jgi:toxin-antitoxin system PIN domain toxin
VIALDTQILVYAHRADAKLHKPAKAVVRKLAEGRDAWGLASQVLHEFFGIVTHPRIYSPPSTISQAWLQIDAWLEAPSVVVLGEGPTHFETLEKLTRDHGVVGPRIHDARIAAICIDHGVRELWSADRDLAAFTGLRVRNPLTS